MESASTLTAPLRLDLAIRTSKRKKEAKSPKQQRDIADACASTHGHEIVKVHDSGRSESGKTMDRTTLNEVMARVERGETDGLIVALADRLGRAPIEEAMAYVRRLTGVGVLVLADMGGVPINLKDATTETNLVIQLQMARQYWLMTANRFQRSQADAIRAGKYIGPTPLGFRRSGGFLFPHPERGPIMTEAFRLAAQPEGIHEAAKYLREMVPERQWTTDHVRRVMRSVAYLGWSKSGDLINKRAHEPLTDLATWTAAQSKPRHRRTPGDYPLSKLLICERCGCGLVGHLLSQDGGRRTYRRYRCQEGCKGANSINAPETEAYVREAVRPWVRRFEAETLPGVDLAHYEAVLRRAEIARDTFAGDIELQAALGRAAVQTAAAHEAKVKAAQAEYTAAVDAAAKQSETRPTAEELETDDGLRRAVRVGVRVVIRPGRGSIDDRVLVSFTDDDDVIGVLAS